jgi:hypothetical protein
MFANFFHNAVLIFCLTLFLFSSCNQDKSSITSATDSIKTVFEAVARWRSMHIHNYTYNQTNHCWYPWCGDSVRVVVQADTIYSVTPLIPAIGHIDLVKTVEALFEYAQYDTTNYFVYAEFDQFYGFPKVVFIQPKPPPHTEGGFTYFSWDFNQ